MKRKEFINKSRRNSGHYVWCDKSDCMLIDSAKATRHAIPEVLDIDSDSRSTDYSSVVFEFEDKNRNVKTLIVKKSCIGTSFDGGAEASICECSDIHFKNKYVKVYNRSRPATKNRLEKLKYLRRFGCIYPAMDIAFPESIMYPDGSRTVALGISMKKSEGLPLYSLVNNACLEPNAYELNRDLYDRYVIQIIATLLDLHCFQIFVSDLSEKNVMIDEKTEKICFVDSDSFQIGLVPGGGCNPDHKHKEVVLSEMNTTLRYPLHEDFSLAVLLYKMYVVNKLYIDRKNMDHDRINWETDVFQLDFKGACCDSLKGHIIENIWKNIDSKAKSLFADEFHFRKSISIGSWIEALGF